MNAIQGNLCDILENDNTDNIELSQQNITTDMIESDDKDSSSSIIINEEEKEDIMENNNNLVNNSLSPKDIIENNDIDQNNSRINRHDDDKSCMNCLIKDESIVELKTELDTIRVNSDDYKIISKLKSDNVTSSNKLVDAELLVIEKEEELNKKNIKIQDLIKQINDLEDNIKENINISKTINELQDQLDVLKPQAEKVDIVERQMERLRERLDDLNNIKSQLKSESSSHEITHNNLLNAEKELDSLRKFKSQLEEYRIINAEAKIELNELKLKLTQKEEDIQLLQQDNTCFNNGQQGKLLQTQHLMEELRETSEKLREVERNGGIGDGMSELNPVLMQELNRLKAENNQLEQKLDNTSMESLELLEKKIADECCVSKSLQQKLLNTKELLSNALTTIDLLNYKGLSLQCNINELKIQLSESQDMSLEECNSMKYIYDDNIMKINKSHNDELSVMSVGQASLKNELIHLHSKTQLELNTACNNIDLLTNNFENISNSLNEVNKKLEDEIIERSNENEKNKLDLIQLNENHSNIIEEMKIEEKENNQRLINEYTALINAEAERSRCLVADVDEEKLKRRRIEREKKIVEAELLRHRTQLQVAGNSNGSSSVEITAALKEIKTMQVDLDKSNSEIQLLRSRLNGNHMESNIHSNDNHNVEIGNISSTNVVTNRLGSSRPVRVKMNGIDRDNNTIQSNNNTINNGNNNGNGIFGGYFEQAELTDKRIDQLTREKREMIAKNLEENKDRMELNQKLLAHEKEISILKSKNTKITLEKERLERKILKSTENLSVNDENSNNINITGKRKGPPLEI
jgi:uncharacterized protein YigA (DUF484 family)